MEWSEKTSRITFIERYPRHLLPKQITIHSRAIALRVHCYSFIFTLFNVMNLIFTSCGIVSYTLLMKLEIEGYSQHKVPDCDSKEHCFPLAMH